MPLPVRHTPRAKWHDYNGAEYFVTICTADREHYFGTVRNGQTQLTAVGECAKRCVEKIGELHADVDVPLYVIMPNHIHLIVVVDGDKPNIPNNLPHSSVGLSQCGSRDDIDAWLAYCDNVRTPQCDVPTLFQSNGNEINLEMQRRANRCGRLSHIIGQFKSAVTRFAREQNIPFAWQPRYYDHIVRNQNEMNLIVEYIEQNPAKWESDCFYG